MKRFEIVDFLKGYAILGIVLFHYFQYLKFNAPFDEIIAFGGTGIHLFILLSGFGLYGSYLSKPVHYFGFLKKRVSKIYVPYIVVVFISAILAIFIPIYHNSLYALTGHVLLYKMFDETIVGSYGYHLWFISMILQFYLTFHLIMWLKSKLTVNAFLLVCLLISFVWVTLTLLLYKENDRVWNSFFLQYFWEFAVGMVIADRVAKRKRLIGEDFSLIKLILIAAVNCVIYAWLAVEGGRIGKLLNDPFALIGYAALALLIFKLKVKLVNKVFIFIGEISLSVYLLHILVLLTLSQLLPNLAPGYVFLSSLVVILPLSVLYQQLVNKFFKISGL